MSSRDRGMPPIIEVGLVAMGLCIVGVIYLVSYADPALGPAIGLIVAAAIVMLINIWILVKTPNFNWPLFWTVWKWTLLGYAIIAGMLMYTFIYDQLPSGQLALLVGTLAVFAVDIPIMLAFSVARYTPLEPARG
jgi:hypothetical protein